MVVGLHRRSVGVFSRREDAESALHELKNSGFPMDRVSVIAQDSGTIAGAEVTENIGNLADEGAKTGAVSGGAVGSLTGLLVGLGTLAIPGIGPIMLAGATATALATTLAGGAIGSAVGSLLGGLIGLGIPEAEAKSYNSRVESGHYMVIVDGSDAEIAHAEMILMGKGIEDYAVYEHPNRMEEVNYVAPVATSAVTPDYITTPIAVPVVNSSLQRKRAIGVFSKRHDAEVAITELRNAGFDLNQVSLIGKDTSGSVADIGSGLGIPENRFREYSDRLNRGDYLIIVDGTQRATGDLESQVRSKLEANIPNGALAVKAKENGTVTVSGTVVNQDQLAKIAPLAKEIKGVTAVDVKATVRSAKN
jgi:BON domain